MGTINVPLGYINKIEHQQIITKEDYIVRIFEFNIFICSGLECVK